MKFEELDRMVRDLDCFIYPVNKGKRIEIYFDNGKLPKPLHIIDYEETFFMLISCHVKHKNIIPKAKVKSLEEMITDYFWEVRTFDFR